MEPYIADITIFAGNFAPRNFSYCSGQLLAISQNEALFSLLGTMYGGDGRSNFGLPDLAGRLPAHHGTGPGLTPRTHGQKPGVETVTLTGNEVPNHTHHWKADGTAGSASSTGPSGNVLADVSNGGASASFYEPPAQIDKVVRGPAGMISDVGQNQAHDNKMPSLGLSFIIALHGVYPSRN